MGYAFFDGPVLHGGGDLVGDGAIQRSSLDQALLPCVIDPFRQTLSHLSLAEYHAAKKLRDASYILLVHVMLLRRTLRH